MIAKTIDDISSSLNIDFSRISLIKNQNLILSKNINGISFWTYEIDDYPVINLAHFPRLRYPCYKNFKTIEFFCIDVLIKLKISKSKYLSRGGYVAWSYFQSDYSRWKKSKPENAFFHWFKQNKKNKKIAFQLISDIGLKGLPDLLDFNEKTNKLRVWEIKGPYDSLNDDQIAVLEYMTCVNIEANVINVIFKNSNHRKALKIFRSEHFSEKKTLIANFLLSKLKKKTDKLFETYYKSITDNFHSKTQIGRVKYISTKNNKIKLADFHVFDSLYNSPSALIDALFNIHSSYGFSLIEKTNNRKIIFNSIDVLELSLFLFNLGCYKWWITPFLLLPFVQLSRPCEHLKNLLIVACTFEGYFQTTNKIKNFQLAHLYYSNSNLKELESILDTIILQREESNTNPSHF